MVKQPAAYYRPTNLPEALRLLQQPNTAPLAGGTQLIADEITEAVVDLQDLGLNEVTSGGDQFTVGATVTLAALSVICTQELDGSPAKLLHKAIQQAGPNTIRNAATLGGSVASRLADSELLAALLVLEATVTLHTPAVVEMSVADYLGAAERPFGLITTISIPWQTGQFASERVARTPADYPIVSVTLWQPEGDSPRLAATGIAALPERLAASEKALANGIDDSSRETAVAAAKAQCTHPGDFRGDATYRSDMAAVLTRRALAAMQS